MPNVRPGFTCPAVITTGTRKGAIGVPIQAMTVRELVVDVEGNVVPPPPRPAGASPSGPAAAPPALEQGQSRKEIEGVFVIRDGRTAFLPVKTGIVGDKYFEVLSGLKEGDEVITGPFASVRNLKEGDVVAVMGGPPATSGTKSN